MKKFLFVLFFTTPLLACSQVKWNWIDEMDDDFSFTRNWEYAEGIFTNQWGQLSCDGFCPRGIDEMKDNQGRIFDDSLTRFYSMVDTSHRYFTHEGVAEVYAYEQCNHASAKKLNGKIHVQTEMNMLTHTALHIVFDPEDEENPIVKIYLIYYNIRGTGPVVYLALNGFMNISKEKLEEGIVQMSFSMNFQSDEDDDIPQSWEGRIFTQLE